MGSQCDEVFKILLIGDSGVGKSSLLLGFADDKFSGTTQPTIGMDFRIRTICIQGKRIKLQIWDTAGQERFRTITSSYYRGTRGIIIVYDVTNKKSFENLKHWCYEVDRYACSSAMKFLVGNKADLESKVPADCAASFAKSQNMNFLQTSAKSSQLVDTAFLSLAEKILSKPVDGSKETPVTVGTVAYPKKPICNC